MANVTIDPGNKVQRWGLEFFFEYVRESPFGPYMSTGEDNIIVIKKDLSVKAGATLNYGLVLELDGDWVEGDDTLEGNETDIDNYRDQVTVNQRRKAVARGVMEQKTTLLDILNAGRRQLKLYAMSQLRDDFIDRLSTVHSNGVTAYADTAEATKDAVVTANTDRFLFGVLLGNYSAGDHSDSLANVDTAADTLGIVMLRLLKRVAKNASPRIPPVSIVGGTEWYVAFVGTNPFRDLEGEMDALHLHAAPRTIADNPIYQGGDLVYKSIIVHEVPEMASLGAVGAAAAPVYSIAFCGQQAVTYAVASPTRAIRNGPEGQDYGNVKGAGIAEIVGSKKNFFNDVIHGMVQGYAAAAADA